MEAVERVKRQTNEVGPQGRTLAANLRRLREARGMSTTRLSKVLNEMGRPIQATGITKIEKEERRVDVDDLIALSAALGVNPSALLLPPDVEGEIELTGAGTVPARLVWAWADGRGPLVDSSRDDYADVFADFQMHARPRGFRAYLRGSAQEGHKAVLPWVRDEDGHPHMVNLQDLPPEAVDRDGEVIDPQWASRARRPKG